MSILLARRGTLARRAATDDGGNDPDVTADSVKAYAETLATEDGDSPPAADTTTADSVKAYAETLATEDGDTPPGGS